MLFCPKERAPSQKKGLRPVSASRPLKSAAMKRLPHWRPCSTILGETVQDLSTSRTKMLTGRSAYTRNAALSKAPEMG